MFGYSVTTDPSLYQDCLTNKIHFTLSPTASILNSAVVDRSYHPLVQFAEDGMNLSISSWVPVITGGWATQERELAYSWGLSETHLATATFNAAR